MHDEMALKVYNQTNPRRTSEQPESFFFNRFMRFFKISFHLPALPVLAVALASAAKITWELFCAAPKQSFLLQQQPEIV